MGEINVDKAESGKTSDSAKSRAGLLAGLC